MYTVTRMFAAAASLALAITAFAAMPAGEYLDGKGSKVGVILAHGSGGGADSNVVGPLRRTIHRDLGFHTLSLQMPLPEKGKPIDPSTFPEAYERIRQGIDFLRIEKKVERVYLMGYSMGGRTTTGSLANNPNSGVAGYIGVGLLGGGQEPFNTNLNLRKVTIPVLHIYAESDPQDAKFAEVRKGMIFERYKQTPIPATHTFKGYDSHIADAVTAWLKEQEAKVVAPK